MVTIKLFTMPNCSHCISLKAKLDNENIDYDDYDIDKPEVRKYVNKFHLTAYPTIIIVKNNKIIHAQAGFNEKLDTKEWLKSFEEV